MSLLLPPGLDLVRGYGLLLEVTTETLMTGTSGLLGAPLGKPKADIERGGQGEVPCLASQPWLGRGRFCRVSACMSISLSGRDPDSIEGWPMWPTGPCSTIRWLLRSVPVDRGGPLTGREWRQRPALGRASFQPGAQNGHGWEGAARKPGDGRPLPCSTWAEGSGLASPPLPSLEAGATWGTGGGAA